MGIEFFGGSSGSGTASSTSFTPAGTISSTNVQAALEELDTEKVNISNTGTGAVYSSLGIGATDVCTKLGTAQTTAATHTTAKLAVFSTGIGGTEVESLSVSKGGVVDGPGPGTGVRIFNGTEVCQFTTGAGVQPKVNAYYALYFNTSNGGVGCSTAVKLTTEAADGASVVACEVDTIPAWTNATARLQSWRTANVEKAFVSAVGELESTVAGAGIVLRSPDGTRYRVTVADGGTLTVAAA